MVAERITAERLRELLAYDPAIGLFHWRVSKGRARAGSQAGCVSDGDPYVQVWIDGRNYGGHCLAWLYMTGEWPASDIDHWDTNRTNNCWANLRLATASQNIANSLLRSDNSSGFKGVTWHSQRGRWAGQIHVKGRHIHLGLFDTAEAAHAAYVAAASQYFGEFARAA